LIRAFWKVANLRDRSPYLASWRITPVKRRSRLDLRAWHQCGRAWMDQDFTGAISPNAV